MHYRLRFLVVLAVLLLVLLISTGLYMLGMQFLEGQPRDFWSALEFAAETITTTGYGRDAQWASPWMVLFVVALQLAGVMLVYMVVPLFLIPAFEERFEARLPRHARDLRDHVVILHHGHAVESAVAALARAEVATVTVEPRSDVARQLIEDQQRVVYAARMTDALDDLALAHARALIVNADDEENVSLILAARQQGYAGEILTLAEEPAHRQPMILAGATAVLTPRIELGAALASRASHRINPRVEGIQSLGGLQLHEVRIDTNSPLAGRTLAEARIGEETGTIVIGLWVGGNLVAMPAADTQLPPHSVVIAVGRPEDLARLAQLARGAGGGTSRQGSGPFLIAGYGDVGRQVESLLRQVDHPLVVVDRQPRPGVDHVGDVLDQDILDAIDVAHAQGVILALDSDSATLFATVLVRARAPEVPIIARVNQAENVQRIHRAGADFALSISQVAGQMLAHRLLGRDEVSIEPQLTITRVSAHGLAGHHPARLGIRDQFGCSVIAVQRGDDLLTRFDPDFTFDDHDAVFLCGSAAAIDRYRASFQGG